MTDLDWTAPAGAQDLIPGVVDPWSEEVCERHGAKPEASLHDLHQHARELQAAIDIVTSRLCDLNVHHIKTVVSSERFILDHEFKDHAPLTYTLTDGFPHDTFEAEARGVVALEAQPGRRSSTSWHVAVAGAIAGGVTASGAVLTTLSVTAETRPNAYVGVFLLLGGFVLIATLVTALREG